MPNSQVVNQDGIAILGCGSLETSRAALDGRYRSHVVTGYCWSIRGDICSSAESYHLGSWMEEMPPRASLATIARENTARSRRLRTLPASSGRSSRSLAAETNGAIKWGTPSYPSKYLGSAKKACQGAAIQCRGRQA